MITAGMIAYIVGIGRSGSTLIDMVLGSHPEVFSLGEIVHFPRVYKENASCTCGLPIKQCEVWNEVGDAIASEMNSGFADNPSVLDLSLSDTNNLLQNTAELLLGVRGLQKYRNLYRPRHLIDSPDQIPAPIKDIFAFYEIVKKVSGSRILIDSTKSPMRAARLLKENPSTAQKCIHLVRDGRGFLNSKLTKQYGRARNGGESEKRGAISKLLIKDKYKIKVVHNSKLWLRNNLVAEAIALSLPSSQYIKIRYEDFCASPRKASKTLCDFIGVQYKDDMLNFRSTVNHNIGGNPMKFRRESILKPDQKWRKTLSRQDVRTFNLIAGWLNRFYGYR